MWSRWSLAVFTNIRVSQCRHHHARVIWRYHRSRTPCFCRLWDSNLRCWSPSIILQLHVQITIGLRVSCSASTAEPILNRNEETYCFLTREDVLLSTFSRGIINQTHNSEIERFLRDRWRSFGTYLKVKHLSKIDSLTQIQSPITRVVETIRIL